MPVRDETDGQDRRRLGVADMDFRCAPAITEALQKRVAFPNWGYNLIDVDLFMGTAGDTPVRQGHRRMEPAPLRHRPHRSQDGLA